MCQEHSSPRDLGAAAWVGIFIGSLPIIPFGIAAIVYACHKLHLNKLAAVGASNLSCAPFTPFLCVELGHYLLHGRFWYDFNRHTLLGEIHLRMWEWLLGSLLIGPVLGTVGGGMTWLLVSSYRKRREQRTLSGQNNTDDAAEIR